MLLWTIHCPVSGDYQYGCECADIAAHGVDNSSDIYSDFPPYPSGSTLNPRWRVVVFTLPETKMGKVRSQASEYLNPLLLMSGREYSQTTVDVLTARLQAAMKERFSETSGSN